MCFNNRFMKTIIFIVLYMYIRIALYVKIIKFSFHMFIFFFKLKKIENLLLS